MEREEMLKKPSSGPDEPLHIFFATPDEVIALGDAIFVYISYLRTLPDLTPEHMEQVHLLKQFQQRLTKQVQHLNSSDSEELNP